MALKRNTNYLTVVLGVIVVALLLWIFLINDNNSNTSPTNNNQTTKKVSIAPSGMKYPEGWQEVSQISTTNKDAGVVSEAVHSNSDARVIIRIEEGSQAKDFDIDKSLADTVDKLKSNLDNFSLVSKEIIRVGKNQAISVAYQYSNGEQLYKQTQFIAPTANKTFYLTITAQDSDDLQLISADISKISSAFGNYVTAHQ